MGLLDRGCCNRQKKSTVSTVEERVESRKQREIEQTCKQAPKGERKRKMKKKKENDCSTG